MCEGGGDTKFLDLCLVFEKISQTTKRLEIQSYLIGFYKTVIQKDCSSLVPILYLCIGRINPNFIGSELGIGEGMILKVISEATNKSLKFVKEQYKVLGDLGIVASKHKANQLQIFKKKSLTVKQVYQELVNISTEVGTKSQNSKIRKIFGLISNASTTEIKYLIRIFEGKLKIGLAINTVLISLSFATSKKDEDFSENVKKAYYLLPVFENLVHILLEQGPENIQEHISIRPGIPIKPMLSQPIKDINSAFKKLDGKRFSCEYKYDGERAQIHRLGTLFKIYSRNLEDLTNKYPDLKESLKFISNFNKSFIIDGEVVAFDAKKDEILSFQSLSTRKRKNVKIKDIEVSVCFFAFDILYYDGESMINKQLHERRKTLFENFTEIKAKFSFIKFLDCSFVEDIENFFSISIKQNCEGLMIKKLAENSEYMSSKRSYSWMKLKKDYLDGMCDTFDLVVLGCYHGKGKRTGSYGGFLLGCYNDEDHVFETLCKIGSGFSEDFLNIFSKEVGHYIVKSPKSTSYKEITTPDIWVEAKYVWEIQASGVSLSPVYSAGQNFFNGKGLSLRFPRFVRERTDKLAEDATSSSQIISIHNKYNEDFSESSA